MQKNSCLAKGYMSVNMILAIISLILIGCTPTMQIASCPVKPANQYDCTVNENGFALAVRPFYKAEETKKYFGMNFRKAKIIAFQIIAENQSDSKSFLISKEQFSLAIPTEKADAGLSEKPGQYLPAAITVSLFVVPVAALTLAPVAIIAANASASDNHMIKHNFVVNELQRHTLSPGDKVDGFVYVGLPKETDEYPKEMIVSANIRELPSENLLPFKFNLKMDEEK